MAKVNLPGMRSVERAAERLFPDAAERRRFVEALVDPAAVAPCVLWTGGERACPLPPVEDGRTPAWMPEFARRIPTEQSGEKARWHDEGALYALDFSSIFAASALLWAGTGAQSGNVLDVCAAPGGKSVFAHLALQPSLLLCNEVIGKRLGILRFNLKRCGVPGFTQRLDVAALAVRARNAFDLTIVDAPCSGQSLLAKGIENPGCFHKAIVNRNVRRQRRILAGAAETLAPGGCLLYATCTFAIEENERMIAWLMRQREDFIPVEVGHLAPWQSTHAEFPCYRLYPQSGLGAGAFCALLRKTAGNGAGEREAPDPELFGYPVSPAAT